MLLFDRTILKLIPRIPPGEHADKITGKLSGLGAGHRLLVCIACVHLLGGKHGRRTARTALKALAGSSVVTQGIKVVTGRERPRRADDSLKLHGPSLSNGYHHSFPSGHASAAFAVATVLAKRYPKARWLLYGIAAGVGFARVRKSAHYPSDVLAGAAIGVQIGKVAVKRDEVVAGESNTDSRRRSTSGLR